MTERPAARFITLEGGEGAGKSTHARALSQTLTDRGIDNIVTREPGGSRGAEEIRSLLVEGEPGRWEPLVETLLLFAARADHIAHAIKPALTSGKWVICDRFTDSTFAYQGAGRGLALDVIRRIEQVSIHDFRPDLTFVLDAPIEIAMGRIGTRAHAENRFEKFDRGFHQRLRDYFLRLPKLDPARCLLVDTSAAPEAVSASIWKNVSHKFGL